MTVEPGNAATEGSLRPDATAVPHTAAPSAPPWRIGVLAGVTGLLCCVGPTVLAAVGIISGATAVTWGNDLYDGYAWWFRLAGLAVLAGLVWWSLRRRQACSWAGARAVRGRLLGLLLAAVATYVALYAVTSWLERFA